MKASLVSATSVIALLALEGTAAQAAVNFTVTNVDFGDILVGTMGSGTSTATDTGTTAINLTWPAASGLFAPTTTATATLATSGPNQTATRTYTAKPTVNDVTTETLTAKGVNGLVNTTRAFTLTVTGVAPVEEVSSSSAGYVLVGQSGTASVTVTNTGNGNTATNTSGTVTNLNGSVSSLSGSPFVGSGTTSLSLKDTSSAVFTYVFTPTAASSTATTATVISTFTNGSSDGQNKAATATSTISGQGVAPVDGGVAGGNAGNVLVNNNSRTVGVTVSNTGNGNLSGAGAVSNLNGTLAHVSSNGFSGGLFTVSQGDTSTATYNYVFTPTALGATSTSVTANFSNGSTDLTNSSHSTTATITGTGVAPIQNITVSNSGAPGSTPGTGNVGYVLVNSPSNSAAATITVSNTGNGNLDTSVPQSVSNLNGSIGAGTSVFQGSGTTLGGGTGLNDPTTAGGTTSQSNTYTFAPTTRGAASSGIVTTFTNGNSNGSNLPQTVTTTLSGQGVAPVQNTDASASAGYVLVGTSKSLSYTVRNTGDGNLSGLPGTLSNLNGSVSSAGLSGDAQFSGPSPNPTLFSLADTSSTAVTMVFTPTVKGSSVSATITTNFSNGNASGNNQADAASTVLTGQGVAPVNSISSTVAASRIGSGTAGNGAVTVANVGNGNLATGGLPDPSSNLQVTSISGPSGGGFSGAGAGAFTLPDATTSTYNYSYTAAKGTARGTYTNTVVATLGNGSADGMNTAGTVNTTVQGTAVGPAYRSTYGSSPGPSGNPWTTPTPTKQNISFGTVGLTGSKTIFLDITNATLDLGDNSLTGLTIGSFSLAGDPNFSLSGFSTTVLPSAANGGGVLEVAINFTATGAGLYSGDLQFTTDQEAAFGNTALGDIFDYALFATASVPEPGTWLIIGAGLGGLAAVRRRRAPR